MLPAVSGSSISSRSLMVMGRKSSAPLRRGHAQRGHVELLPEQLVPELQVLADLPPQMDDVSRFFHVAHLMSLLWLLGFPGMLLALHVDGVFALQQQLAHRDDRVAKPLVVLDHGG